MLVLSRKVGETIWVGDNIKITVVRINGSTVRIGIEAPSAIPVVRGELKEGEEDEKGESRNRIEFDMEVEEGSDIKLEFDEDTPNDDDHPAS